MKPDHEESSHPLGPGAGEAHWKTAREAAAALVQAAATTDRKSLKTAADQLDESLAQLWDLRAAHDIDWRTILNHVQGLLRVFFLENRVERLTTKQSQILQTLVQDYLSPAAKTVDDLKKALRLIEEAEFDPFAGISGDFDLDDSK